MRLLDLFCCEGGAAAGYAAAGFTDIVGVDTDKARGRYYPFRFVHGDALEYVAAHWQDFHAIHASPPCQAYSQSRHTHSADHPDLIVPTRQALKATGLPYVIENVPGAPLVNPVTLCGAYFGLTATDPDVGRVVLRRHRLFESNVWLNPTPCDCGIYRDRGYTIAGVYGGGSNDLERAREVRHGGWVPSSKEVRFQLVGATHQMTNHGLAQSIPPAYTDHIGTALLAHIMGADSVGA